MIRSRSGGQNQQPGTSATHEDRVTSHTAKIGRAVPALPPSQRQCVAVSPQRCRGRKPQESNGGDESQAGGAGRGGTGWNERLSSQGSRAYFNGQGQQRNDQEEKSLPLQISRDLVSIIPRAVPLPWAEANTA